MQYYISYTLFCSLLHRCFTCMSYSADGKSIIAAGQSKHVCIYSIDDELLIKKFEITQNRSIDGLDVSRRKVNRFALTFSNAILKCPRKFVMVHSNYFTIQKRFTNLQFCLFFFSIFHQPFIFSGQVKIWILKTTCFNRFVCFSLCYSP